MSAFYEELPAPKYVCGKNASFERAAEGLRKNGPFDASKCPKAPQVLFVFPDELKDNANKLFLALKNGIGPFEGTETVFGFKIAKENTVRVSSFKVKGLSDSGAAEHYQVAVESFLEKLDAQSKPDVAVIIHNRTDRFASKNKYLAAKYPLLLHDIPTQVVTTDTISDTRTFEWSVGNVALAMFAKMGGIPWSIQTTLLDDCIIVGVDRATVAPKPGGTFKRFYGFASVFSHDGIYRGTTLFPPAEGWKAYLDGLRKSVDETIQTWGKKYSSPVTFVLNLRKEISHDEEGVITDCLKRADAKMVKGYAVVKITNTDNLLIFDTASQDNLLPVKGVIVHLSPTRAILQVSGRDPDGHTVGKMVLSEPWQIRLLSTAGRAPEFSRLCSQVLALAAMNWRGLNAQENPVSIAYPKLVAEILGRFSEAGYDISALRGREALNRVWFI